MNGRSRDIATTAERGHDLAPDRGGPVPVKRRHDVERVTDHNGPPVDRCVHCGASGSIGAVNPYAECPDRRDGAPEADVETTVPAP
jgi:hypothetical protein